MPYDRSALAHLQARAERYHKNLLRDAAALLYLESRGISEFLARQYLLGVSDDAHAGWLSIPYLRPAGTVWFNYRRLDDGKPKYVSSGSRHIYNTAALEDADRSGEIAIAEGEFDALVATELCGVPAVGLPGATQWDQKQAVWRELFAGYQRIWVLADPDKAGSQLAEKLLDSLPAARLVQLPADVNDTYLKCGPDLREFMT